MNKILIIGFGGAGQRCFRLIKKIGKDVKVAVWNTGANVEEKKVKYINSKEEALSFSPTGVVIATPTSCHIKYAELFLGKAKWILIDKPLDSDLNKCEVFRRNASYTHTKVYVNFQRRYLQCWNRLKQLFMSDDHGEFKYANFNILSNCRKWRDKPIEDFYAVNKNLGGGVLLTECHELDLIQWLFSDISKVCGRINDNGEVETSASMILQLAQPFEGSYINVNLDFLADHNSRTANFVFEKIRYEVDELSGIINVWYNDGKTTQIKVENDMENAHKLLLQDVIKGSNAPTVTDGIKVNGVIDAVKTSATAQADSIFVKYSICPKEGEEYLEFAIKRLQQIFANRIIAVYGLGSLGYGGYIDGWSDFDIDVLIDTDDNRHKEDFALGKQVENEIRKMGFERIDIRVYSYRMLNDRTTVLSYGQCSRAIMLCDSAVLFAGKDIRKNVVRPNKVQLDREAIFLINSMLKKGYEWWKSLPWEDIAAHFALVARFYYSHITGNIAGKKSAILYLLENFPQICDENQLQWMLWALACRTQHNKLYIHDVLHNSAISALKTMFEKIRDYIIGEVE